MNAEHFARVRALFAEASELPAEQREAFVRAQAGDDAIAAEVFRLLGHDADPQMHTAQAMQVVSEIEAAPLAKGRRVGKYEVFEVLGEGGMGQVYRARRVDGPEHWVALKLMRRGLFSGASESRFLAEQQFLARLNHAGIAHYIDSGTDAEGNVYVAMELVQGQRLREFAKARGLNAKQRVELFRQLLSAVSYAHRQLIIHRDIKQANVLVTDDGQVKLLDFGIAKLLQDQPEMTGTRERLYTPTCAAPEQIRGELCDVTTDVYALGVLLYELIAGKSIFDTEGKTPGEFEHLVLNVPPSEMRARLDPEFGTQDIPADLERIVAKAIRKEPNRRYGSVEQFDADLERLLANEPVSVSGNGWLYRTQKFLSRNKLASALSAATVLAVLIGFAITLQQNREIRAERDRANLALDAMKQAFLGADPGGEAGGEVSARDILEKSTENLAPLLATGDTQFFDLATTLLEVQISMGLLEDARRMVDTLVKTGNTDSNRFCLLRSRLLIEDYQVDAAFKMLATCTPTSPEDLVLRDMTAARIAIRGDRDEDAVRILAAVRDRIPITHPDWILSIQQQTEALARLSRADEARSLLLGAKEKAAETLDPLHVTFARLELAGLGILLESGNDRPDIDGASKILERVRSKFGSQSSLLLRAELQVASTLKRAGNLEGAIPYFSRILDQKRKMYGLNHREALRAEFNLVSTKARARYPYQEVIPSMERLKALSEGDDMRGLRDALHITYSHWLAKGGQFDAALFELVQAHIGQGRVSSLDATIQADYDALLLSSYWNRNCAVDQTKRYSRAEVCKAPSAFVPTCFSARSVICDRNLILQTAK